MTPQEKALELIDKFTQSSVVSEDDKKFFHEKPFSLAKQCALIAVDEIIKSRDDDSRFDDTLSSNGSEYYTAHPMYLTYWKMVIEEIKKI